MAVKKLGIIRLEKLLYYNKCLTSSNSYINWVISVAKEITSLGILAPIQQLSTDIRPTDYKYCLRLEDRLFKLPNVKGYVRVFLFSPLIALQIIRMRFKYKVVLCRIPEHGNLFILPLLRLLRFSIFIWLVGDRKEILKADFERRKRTIRIMIGYVVSRIIGIVENRYLAKYPVIANGSQLYDMTQKIKESMNGIISVVSSTMPQIDCICKVPKQILKKSIINLLYVGRVAPDKGLGDLIEAVKLCIEQKPRREVILKIVGWSSHNEEEKLRERIKYLSIGKNVELCGTKRYGEKLFEYYKNADIFVLPSHSEGTPRVLIEAMAFGLPIVATNVGGIPDVIEDRCNGILVNPREPIALSNAIVELIKNDDKYKTISQNNIEKAKKYSVDNLTKEMLKFIGKYV